jgi:hypothetical protein
MTGGGVPVVLFSSGLYNHACRRSPAGRSMVLGFVTIRGLCAAIWFINKKAFDMELLCLINIWHGMKPVGACSFCLRVVVAKSLVST